MAGEGVDPVVEGRSLVYEGDRPLKITMVSSATKYCGG